MCLNLCLVDAAFTGEIETGILNSNADATDGLVNDSNMYGGCLLFWIEFLTLQWYMLVVNWGCFLFGERSSSKIMICCSL